MGLLVLEEIEAAFTSLQSLLDKTQASVRVLVLAEHAKLSDALVAESEQAKKVEAALREVQSAQESQQEAEARTLKFEEKLQAKREEVKKMGDAMARLEAKVEEKQREAMAARLQVDRLETRLRQERIPRASTGEKEKVLLQSAAEVKRGRDRSSSEEGQDAKARSRARKVGPGKDSQVTTTAAVKQERGENTDELEGKAGSTEAKVRQQSPESPGESSSASDKARDRSISSTAVRSAAGAAAVAGAVGEAASGRPASTAASASPVARRSRSRSPAAAAAPPAAVEAEVVASAGPPVVGSKGRGKSRGGTLCFLYIMDKCPRGDGCKDRHPEKAEVEALRTRMQGMRCSFGAKCARKDCMFLHPPNRVTP